MRILGFILLGIVGLIGLVFLGYKLFYFVVENWKVFFVAGCIALLVVGIILIKGIDVMQILRVLIQSKKETLGV